MKTQVILISGHQGSGKTTIGNELAKELQIQIKNIYCNQLIFAQTIYEIHDSMRNILRSKGIKVPKEKDGDFLQDMGTKHGRKKYGNDVWVDCAKKSVDNVVAGYNKKGYEDANVVCIFSDCRFENEFEGFSDAIRIRLECPRETRMKRVSMWRDNDTHLSEISLDQHSANKRFNIYLNTETTNVEDCVSKIIIYYKEYVNCDEGWVSGYADVKNIIQDYLNYGI